MTNDPASFWEDLYRGRPADASRVNPLLAETAERLSPGRALDLGCGPGGDALWLARRGWRVTAVDISRTAVDRVIAQARDAGLGELVAGERHDLAETFPAGEYDLISAQYLQTPFALDRARVLRAAAQALAPGGRLLVVDHGSIAPWSWNQDQGTRFPTPEEVAGELALDPEGWSVVRADRPQRTATGPGGQTATVTDHVLLIQRAAAKPAPRRARRRRDTGPAWTGPDERSTLVGFLGYLRTAIAEKVSGVPEPQVRTPGVDSGTNLLGLVKHLTAVERFYFLEEPITDLRRTFRPTAGETVESLLAAYRETTARADEVVAGWTDLAGPAPRPPGRSLPPTRRWVLTHMIEETARHAGHADILREQIDGTTGR
ncbi:hypothetical protein Acsp01_65560 [Actinoplanes sp. NBRC 101535]|nr:hypothetical protein Acsp01_65560 [Actinoplanes sp. NBRC 101535]